LEAAGKPMGSLLRRTIYGSFIKRQRVCGIIYQPRLEATKEALYQ
jgi:hypothetical protein